MTNLQAMVKKIIERIRSNIHYKLLITFVILVTLLLTVIVSLSIYFSSADAKEEMMISNRASMEMAESYMKEKINDYDELLYSMLYDRRFVDSFTESEDESINFSNQLYKEEKLFNIFNSDSSDIERVSAYTSWNEQEIISADYNVKTIEEAEGWENLTYQGDPHFQTSEDFFTLKKNVIRFETREVIGGISISVDWDTMRTVFDMLKDREESTLLLVNQEAEIIHSSYDDQVIDGTIQSTLNRIEDMGEENLLTSDTHYIFIQPINAQLFVAKFIPKSILFEGGSSILKVGIFIGILAIMALMVFTLFFYMRVTRPVKQLATEMDQISLSDFQTTLAVDERRSDEVRTLQFNFVRMIEKMKKLIEMEYKHEFDKQTAQYQALQNQINPHFLHNSLQVIGNMALSKKGEEVYSVISSLSQMLRYTLRANKDIATIKEETEHLKQYLYIQKQRFKEKLRIDFYIDEEVKQSTLPILTLQPIVENAFSHAFTDANKTWELYISIESVLGEVEIKVIDNGKGIEQKKLQEMNQNFLQEPKDTFYMKKSMGLKNVNNRLKLIYGKQYGIHVESEVNQGTEIIIQIPSINEGES